MRTQSVARWAGPIVALVTLVGCATTPSRTAGDYKHKVANTAESMVSAVASARLAAQMMLDGKAFGPYTSVNVGEAENDANSIASTFDSVQPPDAESDDLRDQLDTALEDATSAITDLRIAVRRGDRAGMRAAIDDLNAVEKALDPLQDVA